MKYKSPFATKRQQQRQVIPTLFPIAVFLILLIIQHANGGFASQLNCRHKKIPGNTVLYAHSKHKDAKNIADYKIPHYAKVQETETKNNSQPSMKNEGPKQQEQQPIKLNDPNEQTLMEASSSFSSSLPSTSTSTVTTTTTKTTHLIFPGGGIFFNWQGGIISYLREQGYDLSACTFSGSSAGSMTATLAATGVDFYKATDLALQLAVRYNVWDRPQGLQGILHSMLEEWLETLLPAENDEKQGTSSSSTTTTASNCYHDIIVTPETTTTTTTATSSSERLSILVTPVPFLWEKKRITTFISRQDLIDCNLASIYLPFFSNHGLWTNFRNLPHIDGNFLSTGKHYRPPKTAANGRTATATSSSGTNSKKQPKRKTFTIVLNWQKDPAFADKGEKDLVATLTPDGVWGLVQRGKEYAAIMEQNGKFRNIPKLAKDSQKLTP